MRLHPTCAWRAALAAAALCALATTAGAQTGGGYDLSWSSLGAVGAASDGGGFSLAGTLSPPSAGAASGGGYDLTGGWGGPLGTLGSPPPSLPTVFALLPAWPNPFARRTTLAFDLPASAPVRLAVFDVSGRRVRVLVDATLAPGHQRVDWDGTDATGARVPGGIYFVNIEAGPHHATSRIVLLN